VGRLQQPALSKTPRALATAQRPATPATPQWRLGASPCHGGGPSPPPSQRRVPGTPRNPGCHAPRPGAPAGAAPGDARDPESLALPCAPAGRLGIGRHGTRVTGPPRGGHGAGDVGVALLGSDSWPPSRRAPPAAHFCPPPAAGRAWVAAQGWAPFVPLGRLLGAGAMACGAVCAKDRLYLAAWTRQPPCRLGRIWGLCTKDRLYLAAWNGRDAGIWIPESCI